MSHIARQSTALELAIGPVLDADGVAVTDCVVGDFKLKKTTGNFAALNGSATLTHVSAGVYDLVMTTSDTDTVGALTVAIDDTVNACPLLRLQVIEEVVYDAFYAASAVGYIANAPVNVAQWNGNNVPVSDTAGYPKVTIKSGTGTGELNLSSGNLAGSVDSVVGNVGGNVVGNVGGNVTGTVGSVVGDVGGNVDGNVEGDVLGDLGGDVVGGVQGGVAGAVGSVTAAVTVGTNNDKTGYALSAAGLAAIWDRLTSALTTVGSIGKLLVDNVNATVSSRSSHSAADVWAAGTRTLTSLGTGSTLTAIPWNAAWDAEVQSEAEDALAVVGVTLARMGALTDWINGGRLDLLLDDVLARLPAALTADGNMKSDALRLGGTLYATAAAALVDLVWDELLAGHAVSGSAGAALSSASGGGGGSAPTVAQIWTSRAIAERTVGAPPVTPTAEEALMYLYMAWRNDCAGNGVTPKWRNLVNAAAEELCRATVVFEDGVLNKGEMQ